MLRITAKVAKRANSRLALRFVDLIVALFAQMRDRWQTNQSWAVPVFVRQTRPARRGQGVSAVTAITGVRFLDVGFSN